MALQGDLSDFSVTDIIQLLALSKKTGAVSILGTRGSEQFEGWLYFRDGAIIGAHLGDLAPLDALYTFFTFSAGSFSFNEHSQLDTPTITLSNEMIIMEGIGYQDAWASAQQALPTLGMVPQIVTNPVSTGSEINLEAHEWRVLTMVNGKNTIEQIAQRSGLGEVRTREIVAQLLDSGLIKKRDMANLAETLFPEFDRIAQRSLGDSAVPLLAQCYTRVGITERAQASREQVTAALNMFEAAVTRLAGPSRAQQPVADMRGVFQQVFSGM